MAVKHANGKQKTQFISFADMDEETKRRAARISKAVCGLSTLDLLFVRLILDVCI